MHGSILVTDQKVEHILCNMIHCKEKAPSEMDKAPWLDVYMDEWMGWKSPVGVRYRVLN